MESASPPDRWRLEWMAVAVVSAIGAGLRSWPPGRLGLTHFDEGIYALVASWSMAPDGLWALDPMVIPYAPPGYPILAGLSTWVLGRSDFAAIVASQLAAIATIPAVAWLARRSFGPGAGFAAGTFAAFSGPHVAFSRMALTDASFLLAWVVAIGIGMRFLERPGFSRALALGLGVGLAQQFKYNGWLVGGIVAATAALGLLVRPEDRRPSTLVRTFGWGAIAAGVAWLVVWPWYRFVERHGGYSDLLRHQRSYLGGVRDWWPHLLIQGDQSVALSGGAGLILAGLVVAGMTPIVLRPPDWVAAPGGWSAPRRFLGVVIAGIGPGLFVLSPGWLGLTMAPWLLSRPSPTIRLVGVWWLVLAVLTPFYHPYARLWLPIHAVNWLLMGWLVADGIAAIRAALPASGLSGPRTLPLGRIAVAGILLVVGSPFPLESIRRGARPQADLLAPSDLLRRATSRIASILPGEVVGLRLLVRPPVTFYLAGRVALFPMAGSDQLLAPAHPRTWALVDSAILRSELGEPAGGESPNLLARFANHWELVEEFPTTMALPTALDLDPGAARRATDDRPAPLWLLRPRRPGTAR